MTNYLLSDLFLVLSFVIVLSAQFYVNFNYKKYSKELNKKGITGGEAAREVLDKNGLQNVYVVETKGTLTDHYDPSRKVIRLSRDIYRGKSISAVSIALHECGHALQDKDGYGFMRFRAFLVPFVNFASRAGYFVILLGIIFQMLNLIKLGIIFECVILLFQIITLPVEINASKRAIKFCENYDILRNEELSQGKKVLIAAALTYVASIASNILEIVRLLLIFRSDD